MIKWIKIILNKELIKQILITIVQICQVILESKSINNPKIVGMIIKLDEVIVKVLSKFFNYETNKRNSETNIELVLNKLDNILEEIK